MSKRTLEFTLAQAPLVMASLVLAAVAISCTPKPLPPPEVPVPATVKSFTVSPDLLDEPGQVVLSWDVEHATHLSIARLDGSPVEGVDPTRERGSVQVEVEESTFFVLTARGEGGSDSSAVGVTVRVAGTHFTLFAAVPAQITAGESSTLVWMAPPGEAVSIRENGAELLASAGQSGSLRVTPQFSASYQLSVGGELHEAQVSVLPAIHAFDSDVKAGAPGDPVTLRWSVGGATRVSLHVDGRGEVASTTSAAQIADGSFDDILDPGLPQQNGLVIYTLVAEAGTQVVSRELIIWAGVDPAVLELTAPPFVVENGQFQVRWKVLGANRLEISADGATVFTATTAAQVAEHFVDLRLLTSAMNITLTASNDRGGRTVQTVRVEPVGMPLLVSFTASPDPVPNGGDPITLTWEVTNARNVVIEDLTTGRQVHADSGVGAEQGQVTAYANRQTEYRLTADNTVGNVVVATASLDVTTPAKLIFSHSDVPVGANISVTGTSVAGVTELIGLPTFSRNAPGEQFVDILATGTSIAYAGPDTTAKLVTLPEVFTTRLFGEEVSGNQVSISINGWFVFRTASFAGPDFAVPFPTATLPGLSIAPYMDDLRDPGAEGEIYYRLDTVNGEQRLIIQWDKVQFDLNNVAVAGSELTFQAQVYASGKVVFAYQTLKGFTQGTPTIGMQNAAQNSALTAPINPAEGDTFSFFGRATLPVEVRAMEAPFTVLAPIGNLLLEIEDQVQVISPGLFFVSEVNPHPPVTTPEGEWFEVTNTADRAFDLSDWKIDFGGGNVHQIPASAALVLPPNGVLLFASSADPAENGGISPDYVYGAGYPLDDGAGSIGLVLLGVTYDRATWNATSGQAEGVSVRFDPVLPGHFFLPGVVQSSCAGMGAYGGQTGSPGIREPGCFPYRMEVVEQGAFESLENLGTRLNGPTQNQDFIITLSTADQTLPVPIKWGNKLYNTLTVSDNGYIALRDVPDEPVFVCTVANCHSANKLAFNAIAPTRLVAPFWDLLSGTAAPGGMYFHRFDPDPTVSGDEYTVLSWEKWLYGTTTTYNLNFQVKFFDNGDIEYHYGDLVGASDVLRRGSSATTWLESEDGTTALVHHITTNYGPLVESHSAIRYQFVP